MVVSQGQGADGQDNRHGHSCAGCGAAVGCQPSGDCQGASGGRKRSEGQRDQGLRRYWSCEPCGEVYCFTCKPAHVYGAAVAANAGGDGGGGEGAAGRSVEKAFCWGPLPPCTGCLLFFKRWCPMSLTLEDVGHHTYADWTRVCSMMQDALARFILLPDAADAKAFLDANRLHAQSGLRDFDFFEEITPAKWEYIAAHQDGKTLRDAELQSGDILVVQPKLVGEDFLVRGTRSSVDVFHVGMSEGVGELETAGRIASSRALMLQGALAEREAAAKQKEADAVMAKLLEEEAAQRRAQDEKKKREEDKRAAKKEKRERQRKCQEEAVAATVAAADPAVPSAAAAAHQDERPAQTEAATAAAPQPETAQEPAAEREAPKAAASAHKTGVDAPEEAAAGGQGSVAAAKEEQVDEEDAAATDFCVVETREEREKRKERERKAKQKKLKEERERERSKAAADATSRCRGGEGGAGGGRVGGERQSGSAAAARMPAAVSAAPAVTEGGERDDGEETCSICLDNVANGQLKPCKHSFCGQCILQLKKRAVFLATEGVLCPHCRAPVKEFQLPDMSLEPSASSGLPAWGAARPPTTDAGRAGGPGEGLHEAGGVAAGAGGGAGAKADGESKKPAKKEKKGRQQKREEAAAAASASASASASAAAAAAAAGLTHSSASTSAVSWYELHGMTEADSSGSGGAGAGGGSSGGGGRGEPGTEESVALDLIFSRFNFADTTPSAEEFWESAPRDAAMAAGGALGEWKRREAAARSIAEREADVALVQVRCDFAYVCAHT